MKKKTGDTPSATLNKVEYMYTQTFMHPIGGFFCHAKSQSLTFLLYESMYCFN